MKRILILVIIVLLTITICFAIFSGIPFIKIKSIKDIKTASNNLDEEIEKSKQIANQEYPSKVQTLEDAIRNLKLAKEQYESKNPYSQGDINIGALEVKTYKIHYLWTILGNYRKDRGVDSLNLDLKATQTQDVYDLQFTLVGNYISITDFLYDIEDDEELKFQIKDLKITRTDDKVAKTTTAGASASADANNNTNTVANTTANNTTANTTANTTTNSTTAKTNTPADSSDGGRILKATFTVQNIGITLD